MAKELRPVDISNMPELLRLVEEVENTKQPVVLRRDSEDVAVVNPVRPPRARRGGPVSKDSPLWSIVGSAESRGRETFPKTSTSTWLRPIVTETRSRKRLSPEVRKHVKAGTQVFTDALKS